MRSVRRLRPRFSDYRPRVRLPDDVGRSRTGREASGVEHRVPGGFGGGLGRARRSCRLRKQRFHGRRRADLDPPRAAGERPAPRPTHPGRLVARRPRGARFPRGGSDALARPGVILGHTQHLAWGMTNGTVTTVAIYRGKFRSPTSDDISKERLGPCDAPQRDVRRAFRSTGRARLLAYAPRLRLRDPRHHALRRGLDRRYAAPLRNRPPSACCSSREHDDVLHALAQYPGPPRNFVFADDRGNAGYVLAGRFRSIRSGLCGRTMERAPRPSRRRPFRNPPHVAPSRSTVAFTANARVYANVYPYRLTAGFAPPYRAAASRNCSRPAPPRPHRSPRSKPTSAPFPNAISRKKPPPPWHARRHRAETTPTSRQPLPNSPNSTAASPKTRPPRSTPGNCAAPPTPASSRSTCHLNSPPATCKATAASPRRRAAARATRKTQRLGSRRRLRRIPARLVTRRRRRTARRQATRQNLGRSRPKSSAPSALLIRLARLGRRPVPRPRLGILAARPRPRRHPKLPRRLGRGQLERRRHRHPHDGNGPARCRLWFSWCCSAWPGGPALEKGPPGRGTHPGPPQ